MGRHKTQRKHEDVWAEDFLIHGPEWMAVVGQVCQDLLGYGVKEFLSRYNQGQLEDTEAVRHIVTLCSPKWLRGRQS